MTTMDKRGLYCNTSFK